MYKNGKLKILKKEGFSDFQIAKALKSNPCKIRLERIKQNISFR